ncbi:39S ribosomal protein L23, mitochondrial [Platysternon megacephalum]|uniref:39S ribosomal protein L23, mitochondrial n=1 Tax=Platysternon megacephalum TaxID=55544 RepID=A0A4D9EQA1_9SAUR|nr:39S ribosomal protein L23, mitochondrial [Platysternon megacephalum]
MIKVCGLHLDTLAIPYIAETKQAVERQRFLELITNRVNINSQVELKKKGDDDKEEDKDGDCGQEEYGTREAQTEDLKVEEVLLEVQASNCNSTNCSSFNRANVEVTVRCISNVTNSNREAAISELKSRQKDLSTFVEIDLRDEVEEAPKQLAVLLSNLDKAEEEKDKNRIAMKRSNEIPSTMGFSSFSLPLAYWWLFCPSTVTQTTCSGRCVTKEAGIPFF